MSQTQYGFARTVCACNSCRKFCGHLSGMVSPADLARWREAYTAHERWFLASLAASPGALVLQQGQVRRIPTIVPRRTASGRCHFFTKRGDCGIHASAPYGCGWFDSHMPRAEADPRSQRALEAIAADFAQGGPYSQLWQALHDAGHVVDGPEAARRHLRNP
jgi:hypothetical protein